MVYNGENTINMDDLGGVKNPCFWETPIYDNELHIAIEIYQM